MWARGASLPCQGIAWVGAIKTMRRRSGKSSPGIASQVMREVVRSARERGHVLTALMPFRGSFYEHFGYGLVEWRNEWTIPMAILPTGDFDGIRFYEPEDFAARAQCLARVNQAGQCAVERSEEFWRAPGLEAEEKTQIVDRPSKDGPVRGSMFLATQPMDGRSILRVTEAVYEDPAALRRQLHFLSSLKDQYCAVQIQLPRDVPLNWLLKEAHLMQRQPNHPVPELRPSTRMQVRILDHKSYLEALYWPLDVRGSATVSVREIEGHETRFQIDVESGRASVKPSGGSPDFECPDRVWAAVACGETKASDAIHWGLAHGADRGAVLNSLAIGPAPFCREQF
jgi:predicted acetyltransferase